MSDPIVSVIMSVYNGARDVSVAVRSILAQTLEDFEFIAIDNGSFKDDTREVLDGLARSTSDERLKIVHIDKNEGLAPALNHAISMARGRYIARIDHDDIAKPDRLAKQVAFMTANPDYGLLGTRAEIWVGDQPTERRHDHPTDNATLQFDLLFDNPFVQSSIIMRRSVLDAIGAYSTDPARQPPEDYELWSRVARHAKVANLPEHLVVYREVPQSMSRAGGNLFREKILLIAAENIATAAGLPRVDERCRDAVKLIHGMHADIDPRSQIEPIVALVTQAARNIEARDPGADLSPRLDDVVANLRHHHGIVGMRRSTGPAWRLLQPLWRSLPDSVRARVRKHLIS